MSASAIPSYFFLNSELHKKIKVVRSDNSVVAWNYPSEKRLWLPRKLVIQNHQKAFTISSAAKLMNIRPATIRELVDKNLVNSPARTYDLSNYRPGNLYFSEDDLFDVRQAAWDMLPKNRFGEPYSDTMANEEELLSRIKVTDSREFRYNDSDELEPIFKAHG